MAVAITRTDFSARELRASAAKAKDAKAARRMLALALVLEGVDRKTAAESCGMDRQTLRTGFTATTPKGWRGCRTAARPGPRRDRARLGGRNWRAWRARVPTPPRTGWCAGGASTCNAGSRSASASRCTSGPWASSWPRSDFAGCRCARSTRNPTPRPRRRSKKRRRARSRCPARPRARQAIGGLVSRVSRAGKRSGGGC